MSEQALITALEKLTEKIDEMSLGIGRGTGNGSKKSSVPGGTGGKKAESAADKAYREKVQDAKKTLGIFERAIDDASDAQSELTKEQNKALKVQEKTNTAFRNFGMSAFGANANLESMLGGLGSGLKNTGSAFGKVVGGFATGVGYALGGLQEFAKSAGDMGAFADLSKFSVGSVTSIKLMSGLGGAFMKVIEDSQGAFRAFGANSQEAAENLSNLSRGLKLGSGYLNSTLRDSLGTDLVKSVDRASTAAAAMGMTDEERAKLLGSLTQSAMLGAKNEKDAQQRLVQQYSDTVDNTRKLSNAFGIGTKEILASMEAFRKTTAGTYASLEGNTGAQQLAPLIAKMGIENDPEKIARIALALSRGDAGAAAANVSNPANQVALELLNRAVQNGGDGGNNVTAINTNLKGMSGEMQRIRDERSQYASTAPEYAELGAKLGKFEKDMAQGNKDDSKEAPATSETDNIKSMNSLTAALDSLRNVLIGLTAGVALLVGSLGAMAVFGTAFAVGTGKLMSGKVGGAIGGIKDFISRKIAPATGSGPAPGPAPALPPGPSPVPGNAIDSLGKKLKDFGSGAGKGIKDLAIGIGAGLGKGIELLLRGLAAGIAAFANPAVLVGATILSASIAIIGAGIAAATWLTGKALESFGNSLAVFNNIDGGNLAAIGGGLAAIGAGAVVFAAGMVAATASSLVTGLLSLFGAKSPIERILELVPVADKISMIGEGMFKFGSGIGLINNNLQALDLGALENFKNVLIEISNIDMPSLDGLSIPQISTDGLTGTPQQGNGLSNILNGNSAVTPDVIGQLMSYLASIESDLAAIRGNTKQSGYDSPVRLS
jgi:hypothetical protein